MMWKLKRKMVFDAAYIIFLKHEVLSVRNANKNVHKYDNSIQRIFWDYSK